MSKRSDAYGFFWQDVAVVKPPKKEKEKRQPPKPTWEHADYLPGLYEALAFNVEQMTDQEVYLKRGGELVFDTECYPNFWQVSFRCTTTRRLIHFELSADTRFAMNLGKLDFVIRNYRIIGFNSIKYDLPMVTLALAGKPVHVLKQASDDLIVKIKEDGEDEKMAVPKYKPHELLRAHKVKKLQDIDHIDLIEVCPLQGSLKKYGARLHVKRMQDLPFPPATFLSYEQMAIVRWYCINSDIPATLKIYEELKEQIKLRNDLTAQYGIDVRSRSDAQVAESVISQEIYRLTGERTTTATFEPGTVFHYQVPRFLKYQSDLMNWALNKVAQTQFIVSEHGNINLPEELSNMKLRMAHSTYKLGVGGLHSSEKKISHIADGTFRLIDIDVESFYPRIILNLGIFPKHLGSIFLRVYDEIVRRRLSAKAQAKACKKAGDKEGESKWKAIADGLKITINGTFGKLSNKWSTMFSPELGMQVTLTGQLVLLMLIERMELACIPVVSANTDGIVMRVPTDRYEEFKMLVKQWENDTDFITEETEYSMVLSRDVNNYMAIKKEDGKTKNKGIFANPWSELNSIFRFHKNPEKLICTEAIEQLITKGIPISHTIRACKDLEKFVVVRDVKGGGVKVTEKNETELYLGKMVRWYYAANETGMIVYANSGNLVGNSVGARPCMDLPDEFPQDLDYDKYIADTENMLTKVGYYSTKAFA